MPEATERAIYVADDFGLAPTIDRAILALAEARALDGASVLVNAMPRGLADLARAPGLRIGLHLDLTWGTPASGAAAVPDLVGADGRFHPLPTLIGRLLRGRIERASLRREIDAQLARLALAAGRVDYVDGHQHVHCLPQVFDVLNQALSADASSRLRLGRIAHAWQSPRLLLLDGFIAWQRLRRALGRVQFRFETADVTLDYESGVPPLPRRSSEFMLHVAHPDVVDRSLDDTTYSFRQRVQQFERRLAEAGARA